MLEIEDLLICQLRELLDAETQLIGALPNLTQAAADSSLRRAFEKHFAETEIHVERLHLILDRLGAAPDRKECQAMIGLIEEGNQIVRRRSEMTSLAVDLSLIAAMQRVEHYGISAYGTARSMARHLGEYECATLLTRTLGEDKGFDLLLTAIGDPITRRLTYAEAGKAGTGTTRMPGAAGPKEHKSY